MEREPIELKEGIITTKELAKWFGISYGTLRNNLNDRLEELKTYCDYEKVKKGTYMIKKVYKTRPLNYKKRANKQFFIDIVKTQYKDSGETNREIGKELYELYKDDFSLTTKDFSHYVKEARLTLNLKSIPAKLKIDKDDNDYGIYGIYLNEELIYIGMTTKTFQQRWRAHKEILYNLSPKPDGMIVYDYILNNPGIIKFKKLISINNLNSSRAPTKNEINMMELALIELYHPRCNIRGIIKPYMMPSLKDQSNNN